MVFHLLEAAALSRFQGEPNAQERKQHLHPSPLWSHLLVAEIRGEHQPHRFNPSARWEIDCFATPLGAGLKPRYALRNRM